MNRNKRKELVMRPMWIALLGSFLVSIGCNQPTPQNTDETGKDVTVLTKRHFIYTLPYWCHHDFGAKHGTKELIGLAKKVGADLDLVPFNQMDEVQNAGVRMSCVLPVMGQDKNGEDFPPFLPGFNNPEHHDRVYNAVDEAITKAAASDVPFVLVFSGYDTGGDRDEQFDLIVKGFTVPKEVGGESLVAKAVRLKVTLVVEMLNTAGDPETWKGHPGYLANNTAELVEKVIRPIGSDFFKLAFDVYHIVMMNEDPIEMIEKWGPYIGYIHVAGVMREGDGFAPTNRGELTLPGQVIDYPTIMAKLAGVVPKGTYCCLEYIPTRSKLETVQADLQAAIDLLESGIK